MTRIHGLGPARYSARKHRRHPNDDERLCMYDSGEGFAGKLILSCYRPALPGRFLCHKHAGMIAKRRRARARKAAA